MQYDWQRPRRSSLSYWWNHALLFMYSPHLVQRNWNVCPGLKLTANDQNKPIKKECITVMFGKNKTKRHWIQELPMTGTSGIYIYINRNEDLVWTTAYKTPEGEGGQIKHDFILILNKIENITCQGFEVSVASWKGLLKFWMFEKFEDSSVHSLYYNIRFNGSTWLTSRTCQIWDCKKTIIKKKG